jgi:putative transposase
MARPLRIEFQGAFYHITSRGNEKGRIFTANRDREKFLDYLEAAYKRFKIVVHEYCLMPNHYHLIMETPLGNLCKCMQYINSSYTAYYNVKWKRAGHLFQGRYKSILVDADSYIKQLSRYIHLNPVRAKLVKSPEEYKWSSYRYYISTKKAPNFLNTVFTLRLFGNSKKEYKRFVEEGLHQKVENPLKEIKADFILGNDEFVSKIKNRYLGGIEESRDLPHLRAINARNISPDLIIDLINKQEHLSDKEKIKLKVYILRKYTDVNLQEISICLARHKKMSISSISQMFTRLEMIRKKDRELDKKIKQVETKI